MKTPEELAAQSAKNQPAVEELSPDLLAKIEKDFEYGADLAASTGECRHWFFVGAYGLTADGVEQLIRWFQAKGFVVISNSARSCLRVSWDHLEVVAPDSLKSNLDYIASNIDKLTPEQKNKFWGKVLGFFGL